MIYPICVGPGVTGDIVLPDDPSGRWMSVYIEQTLDVYTNEFIYEVSVDGVSIS
jgi:hypothetical protein